MLFILECSLSSTLGFLNKETYKDRYKYDFINYHRKELDWFAFLLILFGTNLVIMYINHKETNDTKSDLSKTEPLKHIISILMWVHFVQIIF
jgi:hypothetical protein